MTDFVVPDSVAARAALEVATEYVSGALLNHSIRSWFWAVGFASLEMRQGFDAELLYVSAVMHDVGLAVEFDNDTLSYELAAGHVAWALTARGRLGGESSHPGSGGDRAAQLAQSRSGAGSGGLFAGSCDGSGYLRQSIGGPSTKLPIGSLSGVSAARPRGGIRVLCDRSSFP